MFVPKMAKTRSGKILRRIMKKIINDEAYKFPATIEDPAVLDVYAKLSLASGYQENVFKPN